MKFTKEYFEKHKPVTNEIKLDELIDMDGSPVEGDFTPSYHDIQTGPVAKSYNDNSDYEKGMATTTDKMATYRNGSWWSFYFGYGGTPYSHGSRPVLENEVLEALVDKSENKDIVNKDGDSDIKNKLDKIEDLIKNSNLEKSTKDKMLNIINDSEI
jgi:hypothetical protein